VICRWRDDLYFNIASIVDFQRLEAGRMSFEFPANPLVVPQMCLRFPDIANIGVTGRHFSCFMMAGQHSFDYPNDKRSYWKDECLRLNYEYLTTVLGIKKEDLIYGEDLWSMPDLSTLGPCIESFSAGAELVNSVFTEYTYYDGKVVDLPSKVIDVGWGFERLLWFHNGTLTAYDSVFPREIEFMKKRAGLSLDSALFERYAALSSTLDVESVVNALAEKEKISKLLRLSLAELERTILPMQGIYAIADHSRTLLFALTDGALPSNTAGGYNLRVVLRRALSFISEYGFDFDLFEICKMHAEDLKPLFPELSGNLEEVREILSVEERKYAESKARALKVSSDTVSTGKPITTEKMVELYESHGITPELLEKAGREKGVEVKVPTEFYKALTMRHQMEEKGDKRQLTDIDCEKTPQTKLVFYEKPELDEISAKVISADEKKGVIVLDQTIIYPEGGGQMADRGKMTGKKGGAKIVDAQKLFGVVLHILGEKEDAKKFAAGEKVKVALDRQRREQITIHHTSTHVIITSARKILGWHVWQTGSGKDVDQAHVDITHYEKPPAEILQKIENEANRIVRASLPVKKGFRNRGEAEKEHGFRLYQGGGAIGSTIRVVTIEGMDHEACGGTHVDNTAQLGFVKIFKAEQIQDGVVRLYYKAGKEAVAYAHNLEGVVDETAKILMASESSKVPEVARKIVEEWRERAKTIERMQEKIAVAEANSFAAEAERRGKKTVEKSGLDYDQRTIEKIALAIAEKDGFAAAISNRDGFLACTAHHKSGQSALELLKARGVGGGSEGFARGKVKST
jgi:alanyl-tRNA synthetase